MLVVALRSMRSESIYAPCWPNAPEAARNRVGYPRRRELSGTPICLMRLLGGV